MSDVLAMPPWFSGLISESPTDSASRRRLFLYGSISPPEELSIELMGSNRSLFDFLGHVPYSHVSEYDELVKSKLGHNGFTRLSTFLICYKDGWGDGNGKAISAETLDSFRAFLKQVVFPDGVCPSVFLSPEGALELSWEDSSGDSISMEFFQSKISLLPSGEDKEVSMHASRVNEMADLVNAIR